MQSRRKRIALLVETSLGSGREILRGIARFAHQRDDWELFHSARGLEDTIPSWLENWEGAGVLARIQDRTMAKHLASLKIPVVDVLGVCGSPFPLVHVDDSGIAALVADHFREKEFRHFAFYGIAEENWSERRASAYRHHCRDGVSFHLLETPRDATEASEERFRELSDWLSSLPKPVAIMVCSDQRGLLLLEACRAKGIAVPERIAVASVDNDLALCEISAPPLSSVRGGHFRVGFESARLLDRLIGGGELPGSPLLVPPTSLVVRGSSDTRAITDPAVAKGIRFLRDHLADALTNDQIAREAGISRTLFQQRFKAATGQTIREFILDRRLRRAETLIRNSDLTFAEIAARSGFRHQEYLGHVMKCRRGVTPGKLRKQGPRG